MLSDEHKTAIRVAASMIRCHTTSEERDHVEATVRTVLANRHYQMEKIPVGGILLLAQKGRVNSHMNYLPFPFNLIYDTLEYIVVTPIKLIWWFLKLIYRLTLGGDWSFGSGAEADENGNPLPEKPKGPPGPPLRIRPTYLPIDKKTGLPIPPPPKIEDPKTEESTEQTASSGSNNSMGSGISSGTYADTGYAPNTGTTQENPRTLNEATG